MFSVIALVCAALALSLACGDPPGPTPTPTLSPTPTPAPDVDALLSETSAGLNSLQSTEFAVRHESGAIFVPGFSAKLTDATGVWDAEQGAQLAVDAFLVPDHHAEAESGIYFQMQLVITHDEYYGTDPLSGTWMKQPTVLVPVPVDQLNHIIAELIADITDPELDGQEVIGDRNTYKISGDAPASVMDWLLLEASEGQSVRVELWTDTEQKLLQQLRIIGAIGEFDQPDTVREIILTNINQPVAIEPPAEFTDLTGG